MSPVPEACPQGDRDGQCGRVPLAQATTSSLEALKAYSLGQEAYREKGQAAALPYHQRAIAVDPNFAMGYWAVGYDYFTLAEAGRAREYYKQGVPVTGTCQRAGKAGDHSRLLSECNWGTG